MRRSWCWLLFVSLLVASCSKAAPQEAAKAGKPFAAEPLKIGFIYPSPVGDVGWTYQHDVARRKLEQELGPAVKTVFVENVPEGPDAERVIRQLITDGCKMIVTTSFGYMEPTVKVAKDNPDVVFEHATGYKLAKNLGVYQTRFYEGAYLLGMIAGKLTKTNTLGFVGSHPIPEVLRNINAFTHGARSVNAKAQLKVIWVNSWYDPGRERAAAETLANLGADMLYQGTDSPAVMQVAEAKKIHAFGQDSDMGKYGPTAQLTANTLDWSVYYIPKVKAVLAKTWKSEDTKWGMKEGIVVLAPLHASVPPDLKAMVEAKLAEIKAGTFAPFTGPVKDQAGGVKVGVDKPIAESELWSMNWYVEGVDGKLP